MELPLGIKGQYGWEEFTYRGLGLLSRKIARYLIEDVGIKKGECLAILSESKPEYGACVFASVLTGTTTVPLDIKLSKYELKSILSDCLPTVMFASQHYLDTALELQKMIPEIKYIYVIDEHTDNANAQNIYDFPDKYDGKWRQRSSKSTAFIIYTSGTTGAPKGVEISFQNVNAQLVDLMEVVDIILPKNQNIHMLSILPMNHLFEMTVGFSTFLNSGFSVYYTSSFKPKDITGVMKEKGIQFMIAVPAFLKLLKAGIEKELSTAPKFVQVLFKIMYFVAQFIPSYKMRRKLFKKIHQSWGGRFFGCISGGAPLDVEVGEFFERIGIRVYQGYGLSETSPVVSVNYDKRGELASVGHPLRHFEAKIEESTGELWLRGPSVMKGYHNQPDGHIYITGRIKNMIVLQGGKKVFPEEVEAVLENSHYIAEVCVLGVSRSFGAKDGAEEVTAVIVPKAEMYNTYSEDDIDRMIKLDVKTLSQQLAPYKRPTSVVISKEALPKTTTLKVKRKDVREMICI